MDEAQFIDVIDVLACDLGKRPPLAPGPEVLTRAVRSVTREPAALVVVFDPAALADVQRFAEAERLCCADIGWEIEAGPEPRLRISATPAQLDAIAGMVAS